MATHSFPVIIEVEETALGPVMKILHKTPGVIKFHVDMDGLGKKKKPHGNGGKARKKNCVDPVLIAVKQKHHNLVTRQQLAALYAEAGGTAGATNSFIPRCKAGKWLTPVGDKFKVGPKGEERIKKYLAKQAEAAEASAQ